MDYLWAICFILGSLYFLLRQQTLIAGLLLGLAIGVRLTSGAMLLPFGALWLLRKGARRDLFLFVTSALGIGGACFLPAFLKYGPDFFKFSEVGTYSLTTILKIASLDVFGGIGMAAFGSLFLFLLFLQFRHARKVSPQAIVWIAAIGLYVAAFIRLPYEAGYLIPTLPFLLLLLNELTPRKAFLLFGSVVLLSSYFLGVPLRQMDYKNNFLNVKFKVRLVGNQADVFPFSGPIINDYYLRSQELDQFHQILQFGNSLEQKTLMVVGWHNAKFKILTLTENMNSSLVYYSDFLTKEQIAEYLTDGYQIYYLPELATTSRDIFGVDFQEIGATPLDASTIAVP